MRSLRGGLAAALLFSFALNLLMLAVPLYSMQIYDRVLGSGRVETLLLLSLIAGVALLALGAFEMVRTQPARAHRRTLRADPGRARLVGGCRPPAAAPAPWGCASSPSCATP